MTALNIAYAGSLTTIPTLTAITGVDYTACHVYCGAAPTWTDFAGNEMYFIQESGNRYDQWVAAAPGRTLLVSPGMVPTEATDGDNDWRTQGASGDYNRYWSQWGTRMVEAGLGHVHVRIAHECNGPWFREFVGTTPAQQALWAEYFRQIVQTLRDVPGSAFTIEFNVNGGYERLDPAGYYPGDVWVDVIGIDQYDGTINTPPTDGSQWDVILNGQGVTGLGAMLTFALAHGKPVAFSEWGLAAPGATTHGFGDDPAYIENMAAIIKGGTVPGWTGPLPAVAYHSLFNPLKVTPAPTGSPAGTAPTVTSSAPYPIENAPLSLAAYKAAFG